jgi:hypothetical protein
MTVRAPMPLLPLGGRPGRYGNPVQGGHGGMSAHVSSATTLPCVAAPRIPYAAPDYSSVGRRAGRMEQREEGSLSRLPAIAGDGYRA